MRALGVHIFAGGFSLGVEKHFTLTQHLEACRVGAATWVFNRPNIPIVYDKYRAWTVARAKLRGTIDVVYGNPPCSPFSLATVSRKVRDHAAPLAAWTRDVVEVGADVGAKVVIVESVRLALRRGADLYKTIAQDFKNYYAGQLWVFVNVYDHGVPQWRPRLFWVLAPEVFEVKRPRLSRPPSIVSALHNLPKKNHDQDEANHAIDLSGSCFDDIHAVIPHLKPRQDMADCAPEDIEAIAPTLAQKLRTRRLMMHLPKRVHEDDPIPVVYGNAKYVHPTDQRLFTVRELMRLSGYPDDFTWAVRGIKAISEIGKSVLPPAGAWIAGEVAAYLRGERACRGAGMALFNCASDAPMKASSIRQMTFEDEV